MKEEFANIKAIFDNAPIGMLLTNIKGEIINTNNRFIQMLGYKSIKEIKENIKDVSKDLYILPEQRQQIIDTVKKNKKESLYFVKFRKKNGSVLESRIYIKSYVLPEDDKRYFISTIEDLNYQKNLENNISNIKRQYQQLFDSSTEAVFIQHNELIIDLNKKAKSLFGLKNKADRFLFTDFSPEFQPCGKNSFNKGMNKINKALSGIPQKFEWKFKDTNNKIIIAEVALSKIENGFYGNILTIVRDITKEKKAEEKLKEREETLNSIIDCFPFEIIVTDLKSNIIWQNKFSKKNRGNFKGKNIINTLGSEKDKNLWDKNLLKVKQNKILDFEDKKVHKGKLTYLHKIISPLIIENSITGIVSLSIDITEKVILEKLVEQNANFLNSILTSIPTELWVIDSSNNIILQSDYSVNKWGNFQGKKVDEFKYDVKPLLDEQILVDKAKKGKRLDLEYEVTVDNKKFITRRIMGPVDDSTGGKGFISISFDITELKNTLKELEKHRNNLEALIKERTKEINHLNKELKSSNEELYTTNEMLLKERNRLEETLHELKLLQRQMVIQEKMASIGTLTAGIAHEINNPINFISSGITGIEFMLDEMVDIIHQFTHECAEIDNCIAKQKLNTPVIKEKITEIIKEMPDLITSIKNGITRTITIIKGLRTFSRLDSENLVKASINNLIDSTLTILHNKYKDKVEIKKNYSEIPHFYCFPGKLGQAFLNILDNAIQAIKENGIIHIYTFYNNKKNQVLIHIKDNGLGIPSKIVNKIFDPFFTTKPVGEGTGLGLSIVHEIIKEHNGFIDVKTEVNKGTEFIITLPIKKDAEN